MTRARLIPKTDGDDFTAAMATALRANGLTFDGTPEEVEDRALNILVQRGLCTSESYRRLAAAIAEARQHGPIELDAGAA